jgi:hypothetical protein
MAVDDAACQCDQRLDPGGGLFGEVARVLSCWASRIAAPTAVRIEVMLAVRLSKSVRTLGSADS